MIANIVFGWLAFNAFWFIYMGIIRYQKWKSPPPSVGRPVLRLVSDRGRVAHG